MTTTTHIAPFSGRVLPLDWKRMVGLVTLAPLRIALLTPLIILAWFISRLGDHFSTTLTKYVSECDNAGLLGMKEDQPVKGGHRAIFQRFNFAIAR